MYKLQFGKTIKELRMNCGLTQEELGNMMHTTKQNISSWERDRTQPSKEDLDVMAQIFNCNPEDITSNASIHSFMDSRSEKSLDSIKSYYLNKEVDAVTGAYISAPDSIKDAICKLLDIDRRFFDISRYIEKEGD